ncbi:MAG: DnaA N-terminal domain-containing protein [Alphaproteobacteria bacterium]
MHDERGAQSVASLKDWHPEGNIIPMEWFTHLKFENGKPDVNACLILADIVYWHRPQQIRDEETGMVVEYRKKFKHDLLQRSYQYYVNLFGLSKRQVTDAVLRLETRGLIQRVFRIVETPSASIHNVLFIALNVAKVRQLQAGVGGVTLKRDTPHALSGAPPRFKVIPPTIERDTYTEITTKTTPPPPPLTPPPGGMGVLDEGEEDEEEEMSVDTEGKTPETWEMEESWDEEEDEDAAIEAGAQVQEDEEDEVAAETREVPESEEDEDDEVCQTMILVWNEHVQHKLHGSGDAFPSSERYKKLNNWRTTFGKYIVWEHYCAKIANCRFLMGDSPSGFKVTLEWALNPRNVHKVIEGAIYDKPPPKSSDRSGCAAAPPTWDSLKAEMQAQASLCSYDYAPRRALGGGEGVSHSPPIPGAPSLGQKWLSEWLAVGEVLSKTIGFPEFKSWFLNAVLVEFTTEFAVLRVDTAFMKKYIETHFQCEVEQAFRTFYPTLKEIKFQFVNPQGEKNHV